MMIQSSIWLLKIVYSFLKFSFIFQVWDKNIIHILILYDWQFSLLFEMHFPRFVSVGQ